MIPEWVLNVVDTNFEYHMYVLLVAVTISVGVGGLFVPIRTNSLYLAFLCLGVLVAIHAGNHILKKYE